MPSEEISIDCTDDKFYLLSCNYKLIALVGDCAISWFLLIKEACFPLQVSLKRRYLKVYKVILNFLYAYNYHVLLSIEIKRLCLCNCDFGIILLLFHLSISLRNCPFSLEGVGITL